jgi:hypothetical protein
MKANPPGPMVPTAASMFPELRGKRVIVGVPGIGFRADLRADDPVVNGSRTFVPILTEQDYYRAEIEQIEAFAPLVPVDRVWVEHVLDREVVANRPVTLDAPQRHDPISTINAAFTLGRRLVRAVPDGFVRDIRATTDLYLNGEGVPCVRICAEADWYRWALTGSTPATEELTAEALWVE